MLEFWNNLLIVVAGLQIMLQNNRDLHMINRNPHSISRTYPVVII